MLLPGRKRFTLRWPKSDLDSGQLIGAPWPALDFIHGTANQEMRVREHLANRRKADVGGRRTIHENPAPSG